MKHRSLISVAALGLALVALTGCSGSGPVTLEGSEPSKSISINEDTKDGSFKNEVLTTDVLSVELLDAEVIPVGKKGNELGETAILRIDFEATNLTESELDVMSAWFTHFRAIQEVQENAVAELSIAASSTDDVAALKMIPKGESEKGWISYQVMYEDAPVQLIASNSKAQEVATVEYKLK